MALPTLTNANYLAVLQKNGLSEDQFWSTSLQRMIVMERENFVFSKLAKKERIPKNAGTKIWTTRRYLHLPVDLDKGKLAEGVAPTPMTVEGRTVSGTVNQYGAYIELTDVANDLHFDNIFGIYQPELSRHAAETIERDLLASIKAEASVRFASTATVVGDITSSMTLDFDDVRRAWARMKNHYRKGHRLAGGKPILVAHPNVLQDLLDDTAVVKDLIIVPGYDEKIVKSGSINEYTVYGIYFMESYILEPTAEGSGSANVYPSVLVGEDAFALLDLGAGDVKWYKKGFVADSNDPLGQKATVGYKLWTGGKVLDPMAITILYSGSDYDSEIGDFSADDNARPATQFYTAGSFLNVLVAPTKTSYDVSDDGVGGFEPAGMIVTATDSYGNKVVIDNADITFGNLVAAATSVTMSYTGYGANGAEVTLTGLVTGLTIVA
jgi:N4-gp56 family major capsid protein